MVSRRKVALSSVLRRQVRRSRFQAKLECHELSHLTGRDELKRAQGDLQVGGVGLEVIESLSNVLLELRGVLPRGAAGLDLVQRGAAHFAVVVRDGVW